MRKVSRKILNATAIFLLIYFFRQAIDYVAGENGDFFVGNFDLLYLFGIIYIGKFLLSRGIKKVNTSVFIYLALLVMLVLCQILLLPDVDVLKIVINALKIVVCFFVMLYVKDNVGRIDLKYFCFGFGVLCGFFLVISLLFPQSMLWRHNDIVNVFSQERLQFLFSEPSELGLHAVIVLLFSFDFFLKEKKYSMKKVLAYLLLIFVPIGLSLYYAKPFGSIAIGAAAIVVYSIARFLVGRSKKVVFSSILTMLAILVAGLVIIATNNNTLSMRIESIISGTDTSVNYRVSVPLRVVERSFALSNGVGVGLGNAKLEKNVLIYRDLGLSSAGIINSFFNLAVEGGVVGAVFIVSLIFLLMKKSLSERDPLKIALSVFIIVFQFVGTYFTNPLCWVIYGYILYHKDNRASPSGRKTILFLDDNINTVGGVERVISTLANSLVSRFNVVVVSKDLTRREPFYDYKRSVRRIYLIDKMNNGYLSRLKNKVNRLLFLKANLRNLFENGLLDRPDIIVFGRVNNALLFLPVLAEVFSDNMPRVIVRDAIHLDFLSLAQRKKVRELFPKYVDTFIVSSTESLGAYRDFFTDMHINMRIIYNPIGIKPIVKRPGSNNKVVVSIGRMDDNQKGFDCLINSFKFVHMRHPEWRLALYGDGKMKSYYQQLSRSLGLSTVIDFRSTSNDIVDVFSRSSIFAFPSRYEGYANALVEALSCGVPSVTFDWLMGADEIIQDGVNGSIVKLKDREEYFAGSNTEEDQINFANEICRLIENPNVLLRYSKNGPKIVGNRNINAIVGQWEKLLAENSI